MRRELIDIDPAAMRGLEIGPLASPVVRKRDGDVRYLDHANGDSLRQKYAQDEGMRGRLDEIVDVDYVLQDGQRVSDIVGPDAPFDYIIASHVIEHIPDPVTWLADLATVLAPNGILSLVIPDKRYTFDINRSPTDISEIVDAYLRRLTRPSYKQVYDFFSRAINGQVDAAAVWAGNVDYTGVVRTDFTDPDLAALSVCETVLPTSEFVDAHCQVFTPASFLTLCEKLARLDLIDFELAHFLPTQVNTVEFHVSLRRLPSSTDKDVLLTRKIKAIESARADLASPHENWQPSSRPGSAQPATTPGSRLSMVVSEREQTLLLFKRRLLASIRSAVHLVR